MSFRNWILHALPHGERELLAARLQPVRLEQREVLMDAAQRIERVCFPEDALVSLVSVMEDGSAIETAMVGCEGMVGLPLFHGVDRTTAHAFVQVPGTAHVLPAGEFTELLESLPTLRRRLHRYAVALLASVSQVSACNRKHSIDRRCARWLLTVHDGAGHDQFEVTHQFLSQMLGVRRATVTVAAGVLQEKALIAYSRGRVTIRDRAGLEGEACECYRIIRTELERLRDGVATNGDGLHPRTSADGRSLAGDGAPTVAEDGDLMDLYRRGALGGGRGA